MEKFLSVNCFIENNYYNEQAPNWIDLHAMTKSESLITIQQSITESMLIGNNILYINHGKGTGELRKYVQKILKRYKDEGILESYNFMFNNKGGDGVTKITINLNNKNFNRIKKIRF